MRHLRLAVLALPLVLPLLAAPPARGQDEKTSVTTQEATKKLKPLPVVKALQAVEFNPNDPAMADELGKRRNEVQAKRLILNDGSKDYITATPPRRKRLGAAAPLPLDATSAHTPVAAAAAPEFRVDKRPFEGRETGGLLVGDLEPSVATTKTGETLCVGNFFTSYSDGRNPDGTPKGFKEVNVNSAFDRPANSPDEFPYYCDQVTLYDGRGDRNLLLWYLQYYPKDNKTNTMRLAAASGKDKLPGMDGWRYYDLTPADLNPAWGGDWFDYPELALGRDFLYISTNVFHFNPGAGRHEYRRCVVLRMPLSALETPGAEVPVAFFESDASFSLRPTQNARDGWMHLIGHNYVDTASEIEVYSWSEDKAKNEFALPARKTFAVAAWDGPVGRGYRSICPDGNAWLGKADPRVTAAWSTGTHLGAAWTVNADSARKHPHVRAALLELGANGTPSKVFSQPALHSPDFAFAYPAVGVSTGGRVGVSVAYGGGPSRSAAKEYPSTAVGYLDMNPQANVSPWQLVSAVKGEAGPPHGAWGDYYSVRPAHNEPLVKDGLVATGHVLEKNGRFVPYLITFGEKGTGTAPTPDPKPDVKALKAQAEKLRKELDELDRLIKQLESSGGR